MAQTQAPIEQRVTTDPALRQAVEGPVVTSGNRKRPPTKKEKALRTESLDKMTHQPKTQSQGFGESRNFGAPEGVFDDDTLDWSQLTLNGQPIPEHLRQQIPYSMTDQGVAEANIGKQERRVEILRDAPLESRGTESLTNFTRELDRDAMVAKYRESIRQARGEDGMQLLMKRHLPEGHRGLWISKAKADGAGAMPAEGLMRNGLEYVPVKDANGNMITLDGGRMFLASVPEEAAQAAELENIAQSKALLDAEVSKVRAHQDEVLHQAGLRRETLGSDTGLDFAPFDGDGSGMDTKKVHTFRG